MNDELTPKSEQGAGLEASSPEGKTELSTEEQIRAEVEETVQELEGKVEKKEEKPPEDAPLEFSFDQLKNAYYQNEYGDADITVPVFQKRFVLDNTTGDFYTFRDHRWHMCQNREQEAAFREVADVYGKEAAVCSKRSKKLDGEGEVEAAKKEKGWQKNFNERATKLRGSARMRNVLGLATAGEGSLGMSGEDWNMNHSFLPVANGVVDLETGKLRAGKFNDWFSHGSPVEYDKDCDGDFVPNLMKQLLCDDKELIVYIEHMLGFCTTGIQTKDFFVAYGPLGNNGKSVIFDWVSHVLGGFAAPVPVEMIYYDRFGKDPDKPSPQKLALRNLRMAIMSEPESGKRLSTGKTKDLTSGTDKIKARNLNEKQLIEFWPTHTLIMHCNDIPRVVGSQGPFYDRLKLIPFRARFVKNIKEVDEKNNVYLQTPRGQIDALLREHDQEMLAYLIRCARKAIHLGDMPEAPAAINDETKAFREEEDLVGRYLDCCTEKKEHSSVRAGEFHNSFSYYCNVELGISPKGIPALKTIQRDVVNQPHIERIGKSRISYKGIHIIDEWVPDPTWKPK